MVKTEDISNMADGWREVFKRSRLVPAPSQTVRLAVESHFTQSHGFQLSLSRLSAVHLPQSQEMPEVDQDLTYQLRVTLFDRNHQHFFGRTWRSSPQRMKNNKIPINEVLYFHTSLRLPSTVVVLELVSLSPRPDGSQQALGRGFTVLELFTNRPEAQAADGDRRLNLHHGSPRSLLHPLLKDTVDYSSVLKTIDSAHLECVVKRHPALVSMMHLLPENVLVSGDENIPGLAASPTGDALLRPQPLKMMPFTLNRLTISLQPSLETFESQLLQLINADCHNTTCPTKDKTISLSSSSALAAVEEKGESRQTEEKQPGPEGTLRAVVIQERRLHVGVHNGWCFLDKPQVVVLEPLGSGTRGRADSPSKQSTLVKDSSAPSLPQILGLRSSLELKLTNHQALAVVFQLEYVFSAPIGRETMLSTTSSSRAAFLQCLRWGSGAPSRSRLTGRGRDTACSARRCEAKPSRSHGLQHRDVCQDSELCATLSSRHSSGERYNEFSAVVQSGEEGVQPKGVSEDEAGRCVTSEEITFITLTRSETHCTSFSSRISSRPRALAVSAGSYFTLPDHQPLQLRVAVATVVSFSAPSFPVGIGPPAVTCRLLSCQQHCPPGNGPSAGGGVSPSGQNEGDQLQELPFTPVHAPVITLGMNVPSSSSVSSRSSLAHLYSAGFPEIMDCSGQVAEVLDPTEPVPFDPQREEKDPLQGNLLVFQFLAFTRIPSAGVGPDWPENVYFTFQFYRFPPVTSQQLKLLTSDRVQHKASDPLPCVLASINKDGTVNSAVTALVRAVDPRKDSLPDGLLCTHEAGHPGSPGLQVQFRVNDGFLKPGEKRWFLRYLALHTLHIDIWDSDSLLLIGSTAIELKYMLRQGKSAVQALHEVEVLTTDYVGDDTLLTSSGLGRRSASGPITVHTVVRGRLHIRTGNIGCPVDPIRRRAVDIRSSHPHIITPREVTSGFRGGSLSSRNILQLNARNAAQAHRLEMDGDQEPSIRRRIRPDNVKPAEHDVNEADGGLRKLKCMAAVHQREGKEGVKAAKAMDQTKEAQLARERLQIKPSEERSKAEGIANMLSQAITTQHLLYASLGSAEYMEFVLKNPFNVPQTVTIHTDDPELSVITKTEEWRYFKALTKTPTPLEENMFHVEEGAPGPRVYLRPKESVHIPLKYQSFLCDHTMAVQGPSLLPAGKGSQVAKKKLSNIVAAKTIKVTFKAEDSKPMAICQVNVEPTPHVVDQTFRLYHPELCFLKKAIRLPPWHDPTVADPDSKTHLCVRCSDPNVICQTRMLVPGEPQDVYLKVPGSPSPHIKMFFVMVFTDKWMAAPSQIWQIYIHFLERVDVSCVSGQRTCQSLVLRGRQAVRKVKCFSSHPKEIQVDPESVFVLPPAAVQELQLKVQPWRAGSRFLYVNAVDVESHRLVTAWLLCLNVHQPVLSKAFEVCVPVGGGRGSSRKITYTNPYTSSHTFLLRSDHPDLLQFKEDQFQIGRERVTPSGLRFAPSQSPGSVEILVYVNNLEEKTEETFCVKVNYS